MSKQKLLDPITPGEILREDFLEPLDISINQLARDLSVPPNRISEIINGKRGMTPSTALRLEKYFGMSASFWLNLQLRWDLYFTQQAENEELATISPHAMADASG